MLMANLEDDIHGLGIIQTKERAIEFGRKQSAMEAPV